MTKKQKNILELIIFLFFCASLPFILPFITKYSAKPDVQGTMDSMRTIVQNGLQESADRINAQNRFRDSIDYLIVSGHLNGADSVINQLLQGDYQNDVYWTWKGEVYVARKQYGSALYCFDTAVAIKPYSKARDDRARTFIRMKRFDDALKDFIALYNINDGYSYQLGQIYELIKQRDSAIKYYKISLQAYPLDDTLFQKEVKMKIASLEQ